MTEPTPDHEHHDVPLEVLETDDTVPPRPEEAAADAPDPQGTQGRSDLPDIPVESPSA